MKKVLRVLFGVIILVTVVSTLFIFLSPSEFSYTTETKVSSTTSKCFKVFSDPNNFEAWMDGFKSMHLVSGEIGEIGSQYELTFDQGGSEFKMMETATEIIENELYRFDYSNPMMTGTEEVRFIKQGNGTLIKTKSTVKGRGKTINALLNLSKSNVQQSAAEMYSNLAKLIES